MMSILADTSDSVFGPDFRDRISAVASPTGDITPARSQLRVMLLSHVVGLPAPALAALVTSSFDLMPNLAVAFAAWAAAVWQIAKRCPQIEIPVEYVGIPTVNDMPVQGGLYTSGTHRLFFTEHVDPVKVSPDRFDPPGFTELALDRVEVVADAYFMAYVSDPYVWRLTGGESRKGDLIEKFISEIRLFISNWKRASDLVAMRDLLGDYLELNLKEPDKIREFREERLMPLTEKRFGQEPMLDVAGVNEIMKAAGQFCKSAADWGYTVTDVNTQDVALPEELRKAAANRASLVDTLADFRLRQQARTDMIEDMKNKFPDLPTQDAVAGVDLLLGLGTTRSITEISFRELEKLTNSAVARALAGAIAKFAKKGS